MCGCPRNNAPLSGGMDPRVELHDEVKGPQKFRTHFQGVPNTEKKRQGVTHTAAAEPTDTTAEEPKPKKKRKNGTFITTPCDDIG